MLTCPTTRRMKCTQVTILPSASCYAPAKARRWWNTLLPAWTTNSLSLPTCSNCQTKPRWRNSSKMNLINNKSVPHRTEPFELVNILEPSDRKYGCSLWLKLFISFSCVIPKDCFLRNCLITVRN